LLYVFVQAIYVLDLFNLLLSVKQHIVVFDDTTFKTLVRMVKGIVTALFWLIFNEHEGESILWKVILGKLGQHYNTYNIISPNCGAFNFGFHI